MKNDDILLRPVCRIECIYQNTFNVYVARVSTALLFKLHNDHVDVIVKTMKVFDTTTVPLQTWLLKFYGIPIFISMLPKPDS